MRQREHWDPRDLILLKNKDFDSKTTFIHNAVEKELNNDQSVYCRIIEQASNTTVNVFYPERELTKTVRMFGSNNYLGLAQNPEVIKAAKNAIDVFGTSMCGSPFLNGNTKVLKNLERQTAQLKNTDDCIVFSTGFNANTAWTSTFLRPKDHIFFDEESHMSFREGLKTTKARSIKFKHNNLEMLEKLLRYDCEGEKYIYTESLFSMTGDILDINKACYLAEKYDALLIIDEAHGTGTLGYTGRGITEYLDYKSENIIIVGTYSKALASNGGFICGHKKIINYLRILSSQYMFSAALSPSSAAAALQAIAILTSDTDRVNRLKENCVFANTIFKDFNNISGRHSPIVYLHVGHKFDVLTASKLLEERGFFINAISFPAVSQSNSGIRITISSEHTKQDIIDLKEAIAQVWNYLLL